MSNMNRQKGLAEWRKEIQRNRASVDRLPYSHNIINTALGAIARRWGTAEANKAIVDFQLEKLGWKQEQEQQPG